jgi:UDP-N-acetylglucosamine 4,6-dehydratase
MGTYYVVQPAFPWWKDSNLSEGAPVPDEFSYRSDANPQRLGVKEVRELLRGLGYL